jgi:hypothetical protein
MKGIAKAVLTAEDQAELDTACVRIRLLPNHDIEIAVE